MDVDPSPSDSAPLPGARHSNRARKKHIRNDEVTTITTKKVKSVVTQSNNTHKPITEGDKDIEPDPPAKRKDTSTTTVLATSKGKTKGKGVRQVVLTDTESGSREESSSDEGVEIIEPVDTEETAEAELGKY